MTCAGSTPRRYTRTAPIGVPRSVADRLWEKVKRGPDCWLWMGAVTNDYGIMYGEGHRRLRTHRVAWEVTHGPIPAGAQVCHRCDTPLCVRPDHLFLGSNSDNHADMVSKGRHYVPGHRPGPSNGNAKLSAADVREVRRARASGESAASIARRFRVSQSTICGIGKGRRYACVSDSDDGTRPQAEAVDAQTKAQGDCK